MKTADKKHLEKDTNILISLFQKEKKHGKKGNRSN